MVALEKAKLTKSFDWELIVDELSTVFNLTINEKKQILKSPAARLTAEIAYLAGCKNPGRIALAHVGTIIIAAKNSRFAHQSGETLYNRMALLDHYPEGDPQVVHAGIILLQLISLYDHLRDLNNDRKKGKFNPLFDELIFEQERDRLLAELSACEMYIQEMYKSYTDFLPFSWWWSD